MKNRLLLIAISLSLSACSLIYSYSDNLPQRLDQWMAEKKYNIALNTISHIKPTHKDYRLIQSKKLIIIKKMDSYEDTAIEKSTQLAKQGNWLLALELLDEVAENILDTKKIDSHKAKILKQREKVITNYEKDILNKQAINLINKIELYNRIKKTVSRNDSNNLGISDFDELIKETGIKLANLSEHQFHNKQYDKALSNIELALKLNPDDDITLRLTDIKKRINEVTKLKKTLYISEAKTLLSKLSQGYSHEILKETKEKIAWLDKIKDDDKTYSKLIAQLRKHLKQGIKQHFEAGRKLYSKGKTQEALSIWLDLKDLDPQHPKLQAHISRAEKILIKLEELSNKPASKKQE
ncbi:MAG: hypothetical protein OQK75_12345 [Gammaproteobacteria bacterium]|nr:hypothetical protein [Gammaproteobacteria bacterium]MCW8988447.1 hypothetical protein [Gammaproteobacteria bacterium]